jgi:multiple sugar transport system ATP-binding protein
MNLIGAHADAGAVRLGDAMIPVHARIPGPSRDIILGVRPGDIAADGNGLLAEVYVSELLGESTIVNLKMGADLVKMRVNGASSFRDGEQIRVRLDPDRLHLFEADTGKRIELEPAARCSV